MQEIPKVAVVMGSKSDEPFMETAFSELDAQGIPWEKRILSAHRRSEELAAYVKEAESKGIKVFIAGAGLSAALPGMIAARTLCPVIGVPIPVGVLKGIDALLSIAQMPGGIPVATMGLGNQAARNAALFAAEILAAGDSEILSKLQESRSKLK